MADWKLNSLDELVAQAVDFAEYCMRGSGSVAPTMMAISPRGLLCYSPRSLTDGAEKDSFARTSSLICIGYQVSAVVLVMEAWMRAAPPGESLDPDEPPSEAIDRREVVVIFGESKQKTAQKILPIIRTDAGGFFGFGDYTMPASDSFEGRFAQILPPKQSTAESRAMARALLEVMGITERSLLGG